MAPNYLMMRILAKQGNYPAALRLSFKSPYGSPFKQFPTAKRTGKMYIHAPSFSLYGQLEAAGTFCL